ncbi:MAG: molybdopterin molybdotransferase MoeA [Proteobacteria bacterium]|nr:molybdopterin molybdotransferase MoeA [Pseudomonadota bacterium]
MNATSPIEQSRHGQDALTVAQAQTLIRQAITPINAVENVTLYGALDRILAADIISPIHVPAHDNAAMDGYALRGADLAVAGETRLHIIGQAYAGHRHEGVIGKEQCIAVTTGAIMPDDCDTVVPHELVQQTADIIAIPTDVIKTGDNRRRTGEDLTAGAPALRAGRRLKPADLGLLASLGIASVPVRRKLRVAFFSTGDELRSLGETLDPGNIYDSNRYTLFGMLTRLGCELIDMGVVKDNPATLEHTLQQACEQADVILTSGGVSVGAADHTREIMAKLGDVAFWKIAMRPGRPLAFGSIAMQNKRVFLFGLPGNPVATMVSFYFFARPALLQMMGATDEPLPLLRARSETAMRKKPGRTEYQRGILSLAADGAPCVRITGAQGSGILRSMSEANCMIVLPHESGNVDVGDEVSVIVFDGLV